MCRPSGSSKRTTRCRMTPCRIVPLPPCTATVSFDVFVAARCLGCIVIEGQTPQRRIDIELSAVTLLVRIMEELGNNHTLFVSNVDARIWNTVKKASFLVTCSLRMPNCSNDG